MYGYAGLGVMLLVWGLIAYPALRFRRRRGNESPRSQKATNTPLEITWTVLPLLLVIGLFGVTYDVEKRVEALRPNLPVQIAINGFRWGWTFNYLGGPTINGTSQHPPELVLPLGETVAMQVTSSDVVHSFWIPDMLFKRDAVPGRVTAFDLTPTKTGTFIGRCGEFCGFDHALMLFSVRVVPAAEYQRWLQGQHPPAR